LDDGDGDNNIDAGITPPCEQIGGEIFYDNNENGCQDAGESLVMEDINVTLYECGDTPGVDAPAASTTVNDGMYEFGETSDDAGADVCLEAGTEYLWYLISLLQLVHRLKIMSLPQEWQMRHVKLRESLVM